MKKFMLPFLGICMLALGAAAQDKVEITAKMPELVDGDVVYVWNAFARVTDSTHVKDNAFAISVDVQGGGSTCILQAGLDAEKTGLAMIVLLQPGKMHIEGGNGTGFKGATFSGDEWVTDWMEMEKAMEPTLLLAAKVEDLTLDLGEASKLGDKEAAKAISDEIQVLRKQILADGRKFLDGHLNSAASAYVINAIMHKTMPIMEKIAYLSKLTARAYDNHVAKSSLSSATGSEAQWIGRPAPDFSQPDASGKIVSLKDFKGKYVLVDFWASWCGPCRQEVPTLKNVYEKVKDKNIAFVSISLDGEKSKWLQAIAEEDMPWAQLSDLKGAENSVGMAYKVKGIPAKFLIDPNGIIVGAGFRGEKDLLERSLNELMK